MSAPPPAPCSPVRLAVVMINYRTAGLTVSCLRHLYGELRALPDSCVVVVDNCSGDGSADAIERAIAAHGWGDRVRLVRSPVNGGFSAGNNIGFAAVRADYYLLLNSDTEVRPGALQELLRAAEQRPDAGLIGPRLEGRDGQVQISLFRYHSPLSELIRAANTGLVTRPLSRWQVARRPVDAPVSADWVSFAAVLVRGRLLQDIGPMDEGYFMYFEDVDYCRRARRAGWDVCYWPAAAVVHLRGGSAPVKSLAASRSRLPAYYYAARARYFAKFYGRAGLGCANLLWTGGRLLSLLRERLQHRRRSACEREWADIWTNWSRPV